MYLFIERIRNELNRGLQEHIIEKRSSMELTIPVPQTEILDVTAQRNRADLAR
jgi:hypothetical protein